MRVITIIFVSISFLIGGCEWTTSKSKNDTATIKDVNVIQLTDYLVMMWDRRTGEWKIMRRDGDLIANGIFGDIEIQDSIYLKIIQRQEVERRPAEYEAWQTSFTNQGKQPPGGYLYWLMNIKKVKVDE